MPTADLNSVRIHYTLEGPAEAPTLVLSNSLGTNVHSWDNILPALASRYRVLRYDTRGHGQSTVSDPPYSIPQLGSDLLQLIDHLRLDRPHLCGLSLGGLTAIWLAIHHPSRFNRFIFANTGARIGTVPMWDDRIATIRTSGMKPLAETMMHRWFTSSFMQQHPQEIALPRAVMEQTDPDGYIGCCLALRDEDLRPHVTEIQSQCLVITGTYDVATPPNLGQWLHEQLTHSKYIELEAAHLSAWEVPEAFQSAILDFLS